MFQSLALYLDVKGAKNIHVLWVLIWEMLEVPDYDLASWSYFGYGHWSLIQQWSKFWFSIFILKVLRTSMSSNALFGTLKDSGVSWMGFSILILVWICSMVFDTTIIWILALLLDFESAKNTHDLYVLILGFWGCWRFLTGVWHLDLELYTGTGL